MSGDALDLLIQRNRQHDDFLRCSCMSDLARSAREKYARTVVQLLNEGRPPMESRRTEVAAWARWQHHVAPGHTGQKNSADGPRANVRNGGVVRRGFPVNAHMRRLAHEAQHGLCAICLRPAEPEVVTDHDESTGELRGYVCNRCNVGLGYFVDDSVALIRAAQYLLDYLIEAGLDLPPAGDVADTVFERLYGPSPRSVGVEAVDGEIGRLKRLETRAPGGEMSMDDG